MSLTPLLDSGGTLEAVVQGDTVTAHGIRCRYTIGHPTKPDETTLVKLLTEIRITVPAARCQVLWSCVELKGEGSAESSAPWGGLAVAGEPPPES